MPLASTSSDRSIQFDGHRKVTYRPETGQVVEIVIYYKDIAARGFQFFFFFPKKVRQLFCAVFNLIFCHTNSCVCITWICKFCRKAQAWDFDLLITGLSPLNCQPTAAVLNWRRQKQPCLQCGMRRNKCISISPFCFILSTGSFLQVSFGSIL